uniref:Uncharacterized protein n=1 Tax=Myoviridae sp. ctBoB21 TaxID=2827287 RepID=A0A8S5R6A0_9CAUD|nr:MAG TPA: hypothetical protein [Myoviridae sp. ctBoB21]
MRHILFLLFSIFKCFKIQKYFFLTTPPSLCDILTKN